MKITRKAIEAAIGNQYLKLLDGRGYWYFVYDDGVKYDTLSVQVYRLNHLPIEQWIEHGNELILKMTK